MEEASESQQHVDWRQRHPLSLAEHYGEVAGILLLLNGAACFIVNELLGWEIGVAPESVTVPALMASVPVGLALVTAPRLRRLPAGQAIAALIVSVALHTLWVSMMIPSFQSSSRGIGQFCVPIAALSISVFASALWHLRAMLRRVPDSARGFPVVGTEETER